LEFTDSGMTLVIIQDMVENFQYQRDLENQRETTVCRAHNLVKVCIFTGKLAQEVAEEVRHLTSPVKAVMLTSL
jgi:hypothetical protein